MKNAMTAKCYAQANVHIYEITRDKDGNKVRRLIGMFRNALEQAAIGRMVYYTGVSTTSEPVQTIRFWWASNVNYRDVSVTLASHVWSAEITNDTGGTITLSKFQVGKGTGLSFTAYSTLGSQAITVTAGATYEITWTFTYQAAAGDAGLQTLYFTGMRDCFETASSTLTKTVMVGTAGALFTGSGGATGGAADTTTTGVGIDDSTIVIQASCTNTGTTGTCSALSTMIATHEGFTKSGLTQAWAAGAILTGTLTIAWSEYVTP